MSLADLRGYLAGGGGASLHLIGYPFPQGKWRLERFNLARALTSLGPGDTDSLAFEFPVRFGLFLYASVKSNSPHLKTSYVFDDNLDQRVDADPLELVGDDITTNDGISPWVETISSPDDWREARTSYRPMPARPLFSKVKVMLSNTNQIDQVKVLSGFMDLLYVPSEGEGGK
jgi:hypothetical protein